MKHLLSFAVLLLAAICLAGCGSSDPYDQAENLMARKRYSHAIVVYDQILLENSSSLKARIGRGRAYAASGDTGRAMDDFNRAIELFPDQPEGYYRRAMLFEQLGEQAKAELDRDYAHSIDPAYRQAFTAMENAMTPFAPEPDEFGALSSGGDKSTDKDRTALESVNDEDDGFLTGIAASGMTESLVNRRATSGSPTKVEERSRWTAAPYGGSADNIFALDAPFMQLAPSTSRTSTPDLAQSQSQGNSQGAPKTKSQAKTTKSPATAQSRPTFDFTTPAPNPYVKTPSPTTPTPTSAASSSPTATRFETGAGKTERPTGSPFKQAPPVRTGR